MGHPFIGEIRMAGFNFAPSGWAFCDGTITSISQNETLFILIGTTYGGNGVETFGLPDLLGRVPIGLGNANVMGVKSGTESVDIDVSQLPTHSHTYYVSELSGTTSSPSGNFLAIAPVGLGNVYTASSHTNTTPNLVGGAGGNAAHENRAPYLAINFIISLFGIFPSQG
jgi:microcystin-dependent protein